MGTFDAPAQLDELLHVLLAGIPEHLVWVRGFRVKGLGFRVSRVEGLGVQGFLKPSGFRVSGLGLT